MSTWIFQGNPTRFNIDEYILENETILWSIRQEHLAKHIKIDDEVFIWRSDGDRKGSGELLQEQRLLLYHRIILMMMSLLDIGMKM